jgi:lipid II:glycine glycyltransferase (peptidoglycan interpeptide bridge formation enzyme)
MKWNIQPTEEELLAGLSGNWRHNLARAHQRGLNVTHWDRPSPAGIQSLFASMSAYKGVNSPFDPASLESLLQSLDGQILIYGCTDGSGDPMACRACVVQHDGAWDLIAATSPKGRHCYASYAVFWALIRHCRSLGVKQYDLGGIDPVNARGVYDFKRGTGAREHECLGEWERSTSVLLRHAINFRVRTRPTPGLA